MPGAVSDPRAPVGGLVISPMTRGWQVQDPDGRLPPSRYDVIEEAKRESAEHLARHGGGRLIVREGDIVISDDFIHPSLSGAVPSEPPAAMRKISPMVGLLRTKALQH
jgi:hypothetical protein